MFGFFIGSDWFGFSRGDLFLVFNGSLDKTGTMVFLDFRLRDAFLIGSPLRGFSVFNRTFDLKTKMSILFPDINFIRQISRNLRFSGQKPGKMDLIINMCPIGT